MRGEKREREGKIKERKKRKKKTKKWEKIVGDQIANQTAKPLKKGKKNHQF
jgi:hypothetical protein